MIKNLSTSVLIKLGACSESITEFASQKEKNLFKILNLMIDKKEDKHLEWSNWLITHVISHKQKIQYAIFAAKQVINIFEAKYPNDKRPRQAIIAAQKYLKNPSAENKNAAANAANAAYAAYTANAAMKTKIIKYGIKLLRSAL